MWQRPTERCDVPAGMARRSMGKVRGFWQGTCHSDRRLRHLRGVRPGRVVRTDDLDFCRRGGLDWIPGFLGRFPPGRRHDRKDRFEDCGARYELDGPNKTRIRISRWLQEEAQVLTSCAFEFLQSLGNWARSTG